MNICSNKLFSHSFNREKQSAMCVELQDECGGGVAFTQLYTFMFGVSLMSVGGPWLHS